METFDIMFDGTLLRNKYEVFDKLLFASLSSFGDVKIVNEVNEFIEFELQFKGKIVRVINEYSEEFSNYRGESVINLQIDYFLNPFDKKRYRISKNNLFSNLIRPDMFNRLKIILNRDFCGQFSLFCLLSKDLFILIASFLDNSSILKLLACCVLFNNFFKKNENWRDIYFKKNLSCNYKKEGLNWKKVFFVNKELKILKELLITPTNLLDKDEILK